MSVKTPLAEEAARVCRAVKKDGRRHRALNPLAETDAAGMPTALWTGNERNLRFYSKHDYEVVERLDFDGARAWWLWREAG